MAELEAYGEPGNEFNPEIHEAPMRAPHESIPDSHVADVYERGYKLKGTSINSKTRFVIANEVKHHDYDSIQPYRSSRVSESRVFVRILGRLPRRGVYPELTEGLLAMTFKVFLEVPLRENSSNTLTW